VKNVVPVQENHLRLYIERRLLSPFGMYEENESLFAVLNRKTIPMSKQEMQDTPKGEEKLDFLEKRGFTWGALVVLLIVTLIAALVLAYLITVRNFPGH
jgi:hypothetical protein